MRRTIFTEDHEAFRASAREFIDRVARPRHEEMIRTHRIPREVWLEAGRQGLLGLSIPEEYGGAGAGDYRFNAVLAEEQSRLSAAFSSCMGIHSDVCPPYLVAHGTDEQKQRWLPAIASGSRSSRSP